MLTCPVLVISLFTINISFFTGLYTFIVESVRDLVTYDHADPAVV